MRNVPFCTDRCTDSHGFGLRGGLTSFDALSGTQACAHVLPHLAIRCSTIASTSSEMDFIFAGFCCLNISSTLSIARETNEVTFSRATYCVMRSMEGRTTWLRIIQFSFSISMSHPELCPGSPSKLNVRLRW